MKKFDIPLEVGARTRVVQGHLIDTDGKKCGYLAYDLQDPGAAAVYALVSTSQKIYNTALEYADQNALDENRALEGFSNKELKRLRDTDYEDCVNKVAFTIAVSFHQVTVGITEDIMQENAKGMVGKIGDVIKLKSTFKILDLKAVGSSLAPTELTENNIEMTRRLSEALDKLIAAVDTLYKSLPRGVQVAVNLVIGFIRRANENFKQAIQKYELENVVETAVMVEPQSAKASETATDSEDELFVEPAQQEATLEQQIIADEKLLTEKEAKKASISQKLLAVQSLVDASSKDNADNLMAQLEDVNGNKKLRKACVALKEKYDALNPRREQRTAIVQKMAVATRDFRKKASGALKPKKQAMRDETYRLLAGAAETFLNDAQRSIEQEIKPLEENIIANKAALTERNLQAVSAKPAERVAPVEPKESDLHIKNFFKASFWKALWEAIKNIPKSIRNTITTKENPLLDDKPASSRYSRLRAKRTSSLRRDVENTDPLAHENTAAFRSPTDGSREAQTELEAEKSQQMAKK